MSPSVAAFPASRCAAPITIPTTMGKTMRVSTAVTLDAPIDDVWREIQKPALLERVTRGLMRFAPVDPAGFPPVWDAQEYLVRLYAYGVIPIGRQVIGIERPTAEGARRLLRDNGRGDVCRRWDHLMTMTPLPDGRTRYVDEVEVEAGVLTAPMAAFAWLYYALRQRRLKRLAADGFVY